ncbi:hypothetical protein ABG067_005728 [Albugo candida]
MSEDGLLEEQQSLSKSVAVERPLRSHETMNNVAHAMEPTAGPKTDAGRERAGSPQSDDLEVKAEAMPRNSDNRLVDLPTGLAE